MMDERAFSLIEVLVALALLVVLATMVGLSLKTTDERQQYDQTIATMTAIREAILGKPGLYCNGRRQFTGYAADMGSLPLLVDKDGNRVANLVTKDGKSLVFAQPRGLWTRDMNGNGGTKDLADIADGACWKYYEDQRIWAGWRGPYLSPPADGVLRDGWGHTLLFSEGEIITLNVATPVECNYTSYTVFGQTRWQWTVNQKVAASPGTYRCKIDWAFPAGQGSTVLQLKPYPGFASPYYLPGDPGHYPYGGLKWADCWEALPVALAPVIEPVENGNRAYPDSIYRSAFTNLFFGPGTLCVISYGADGKPGGSGYNRDIEMCIYPSDWTGEVTGMAGNTSQNFADYVAIAFPRYEAGNELVQWRNTVAVSSFATDSLGARNFYFGKAPLRDGQTDNRPQESSVLVPVGIRSIRASSPANTTYRKYVFPVEPTGNLIGTVRAGR
jgi:prepilin-type N-terminal cleavage/methylation domain-containing protein